MPAIQNFQDFLMIIINIALVLLTLIPLLSFFGHIFTKDGRDSLSSSAGLILYFIFFWIFFSIYWFADSILWDYFSMDEIFQKFVYAGVCLGILLEKSPPMRP